jgi:hypothetical protein
MTIYRFVTPVTVALLALCSASHANTAPSLGTWQSTLDARDLDGNLANGPEAYYDSALNITWMGNLYSYKIDVLHSTIGVLQKTGLHRCQLVALQAGAYLR